jgi:hypothetical protein
MPDRVGLITRIIVRVRALLPKDWLSIAGRRFRQTTTVISDYTHDKIRPGERLTEAPELGWKAVQGAALEKHARALKEYAEEENERLEIELKRQTLSSKARQENATAKKLESDVRASQIRELQERIKLFDDLRRFGAVPVWDKDGNMIVVKAPAGFDWEALQAQVLKTGELPMLDNPGLESESEQTKND